MRLVKHSLFIALSVFVAAPVALSSFANAAEGTKAVEAKEAQAQEITGKAKLPNKGDAEIIKDSHDKTQCEKCHEKGEPECKACKEKEKSDRKDLKDAKKKEAKADCKDCADCKNGKKNCEHCDHCQRMKHAHHDTAKDAAKLDAKKDGVKYDDVSTDQKTN